MGCLIAIKCPPDSRTADNSKGTEKEEDIPSHRETPFDTFRTVPPGSLRNLVLY